MPRFTTGECELVHTHGRKLRRQGTVYLPAPRPSPGPRQSRGFPGLSLRCARARSDPGCEGAGLDVSELWTLAKDSRKLEMASVSVVICSDRRLESACCAASCFRICCSWSCPICSWSVASFLV